MMLRWTKPFHSFGHRGRLSFRLGVIPIRQHLGPSVELAFGAFTILRSLACELEADLAVSCTRACWRPEKPGSLQKATLSS